MDKFRFMMATSFSVIFFVVTLILMFSALHHFAGAFTGSNTLTEGFIQGINMIIVALATFELGLGINEEYRAHHTDNDVIPILRRTVARFVSIVCVALVLEGLLMVIKYSQLDLAGNLYYPVAIVVSAAFMLAALGAFLALTRESVPARQTEEAPVRETETKPSAITLMETPA